VAYQDRGGVLYGRLSVSRGFRKKNGVFEGAEFGETSDKGGADCGDSVEGLDGSWGSRGWCSRHGRRWCLMEEKGGSLGGFITRGTMGGGARVTMKTTLRTNNASYKQRFVQTTLRANNASYKQRFVQTTLRTNNASYKQRFVQTTLRTNNASYKQRFVQTTLRANNASYKQHFVAKMSFVCTSASTRRQ
jgi:hypothetical protein